MKIDTSCHSHKPSNKQGITTKCYCDFLNRNFKRDLKLYFQTIDSSPHEIQKLHQNKQDKKKK